MFSNTIQESQYRTYLLTDHTAQSHVSIVPERGGIVTSWQVNGQELFYLDQERFTNPNLSVRGGNPILFPICGNLVNNRYTIDDQSYTLKQHGFARDLPWTVEQSVVNQHASLTLTLSSDDQTRLGFPFDFHLAFTYTLIADQLEIHQRFTNHSPVPMPFSIGFHPYFKVGDKTQLRFEIPSQEYYDHRQGTVNPYGGEFDWAAPELDFAFHKLSGSVAKVHDPHRALTLTITTDAPYGTLVFWTVKDKDFFCLEPWTAGRNALNTKENLIYVEPDTSWHTWVRFEAKFSG
ncbi:MAG: aldose epimerase [Cyanobacteria bacterium REEB444]|nr:aldose epimerase [Cyanobacteria bacterium REEB444]